MIVLIGWIAFVVFAVGIIIMMVVKSGEDTESMYLIWDLSSTVRHLRWMLSDANDTIAALEKQLNVPKEMTVSEITKELGYDIKIIKEMV